MSSIDKIIEICHNIFMELLEKVYKVIDKFIESKNYQKDKDVLGVIFYGSYTKGYYTKWSDIDLHIITKKPENYRGRVIIDGFIIEFIERNIDSIKAEIVLDKKNNNLAYYSMLAYGKIIFEKNDSMQEFQKYIINEFINFEYSETDREELDQEKFSFFVDYERVKSMYQTRKKYFNCYYYIYLNNIRKFYQKLKKTRSDVSNSKVYRFYESDQYDNLPNTKDPDKKFKELYLKCAYARTKKGRMKKMTELYEYVKSQFEFDYNNVYIKIKFFK